MKANTLGTAAAATATSSEKNTRKRIKKKNSCFTMDFSVRWNKVQKKEPTEEGLYLAHRISNGIAETDAGSWRCKWFKSDGTVQSFICHSLYYYLFSYFTFIFYDRRSIIISPQPLVTVPFDSVDVAVAAAAATFFSPPFFSASLLHSLSLCPRTSIWCLAFAVYLNLDCIFRFDEIFRCW